MINCCLVRIGAIPTKKKIAEPLFVQDGDCHISLLILLSIVISAAINWLNTLFVEQMEGYIVSVKTVSDHFLLIVFFEY